MKEKSQYRVRGRRKQNASLLHKGGITLWVWVDDKAIESWSYEGPKQRGAQYVYADAAIECLLMLRAVCHLALRATEELARSLFALLESALPVPTYSTLSRRAARAEVALEALEQSAPLHLVIDASGFRIYADGEWKARLRGWSKRRTWRKLHIGVDEATGKL
jgi:hypothetical protein